ncbi:MAG TPA: hypothetical protein VNC40_01935 [Gaiellaceae bacterium]|nr:hypothetical protein [Gaiellaceae bacterium]
MLRSLVLITAVALVAAVPASAKHTPSAAQKAGVESAFHAYLHMLHSPAAADNRIVTLAISSVDPRYAAARLESPSAGPSDMVFHRSGPGWWVVGFGSSLGCDTAPKSVLTDLAVGCTPPGSNAWINNCGPLVHAPKTLVIACADANYSLGGLKWRGWGASLASATGTAHANDCKPYCAAGHFHAYPVTVDADKLTKCGSAHYYARVTIVYSGARPAGIAKRDVHTVGC